MTQAPARILLLGGTGFVGRHVCEKLTRMGNSMTVITRRANQASAIQNLPRVNVIEGDVYNLEFLTQCMPKARCGDQSDCHLARYASCL